MVCSESNSLSCQCIQCMSPCASPCAIERAPPAARAAAKCSPPRPREPSMASRRTSRMRKEYLYRKSLEGKEKASYERKVKIREAMAGACPECHAL